MLLCCRKDEDCMCRRFLECLEECVERRRRKHVHLVDDIHTVLSDLWRYADLVHKGLDVIYTVVRCGIKFVDTVRPTFGKRKTRLADAARLHSFGRIGTVDHLCEDTCCCSLTYASRTAEEIRMCQLAAQYRILQRLCDSVLTDESPERARSIFSCRYNVLTHRGVFYFLRNVLSTTHKDRHLFCNFATD